jgi:hypothetical protein
MRVADRTKPSHAVLNHSSISSATCLGVPQNTGPSLSWPRPEASTKSRTDGFFLPVLAITLSRRLCQDSEASS